MFCIAYPFSPTSLFCPLYICLPSKLSTKELRCVRCHQKLLVSLGHYLYLDSGTSLLASRQRIYISSPVYRPSNETNTMHEIGFYSYTFADVLFPEGMGEIVVYQQFARFDRRPRFVVRAEDANQWMSRQVLLVATSREFRLVFEAIVGQSYYSDMAIDGVSIQPLPPGLELSEIRFTLPLLMRVVYIIGYCID